MKTQQWTHLKIKFAVENKWVLICDCVEEKNRFAMIWFHVSTHIGFIFGFYDVDVDFKVPVALFFSKKLVKLTGHTLDNV